MENAEVKKKPLESEWFGLGEGKGINVAVWENSIQLQRKEKDEAGKWNTTQEFNLAPMVLERLFIRLPEWFKMMQKNKEKEAKTS